MSNDEHFAQLSNVEAIVDAYLNDVLKAQQPAGAAMAVASKPVENSNADLRGFEGRFYNEEFDTTYTAKVVNGKLALSHIRHGDIGLADSGKDRFSGRIEFPVTIEFVRDGSGVVTGLRISNFGATNVRFDKVRN